MSDQYYIDVQGKTAGPFSLDHVAKLHQAGTIDDKTIYCTPEAADWFPVELLKPLFQSSELPPIIASPFAGPAPSKPVANKKDWFCTQCRFVCRPIYIKQGSFLIEVLLWLVIFFPGLIYSIWRMTSKKRSCPSCHSTSIVKVVSPAARQFVDLADK